MAKQLFNSSEKSNFILNMTEDSYSRLASAGIITACFSTSAATIIPLVMGNKAYSIPAVGTALAGALCMIIAIIGLIKKYISKKLLVPVCALGVMLVWGFISAFASDDPAVGIYGFSGRGEGMLTLTFYGCFFIAAACVKREKALKMLIFGIIGNGLLNCAFGLVQVFTGKVSEFAIIGSDLHANAASGLSQSPMFLAMVLGISIAAALMGFADFTGKSAKILCIVSAAVFSFVNVFTYSLLGICGTALAVIAAVAFIFAAKKPKKLLTSLAAVIVPFAAGILLVNAGTVGNISQYRLYDGRILWFADSYMRINSSGSYDNKLIDIDDTQDVYYTLNRKTTDIISSHGLLGTGPDQLVYPQIYTTGEGAYANPTVEDIAILNKGTFDRVYNEYLYTAATRGIPSAIAFVLILLSVVLISFGSVRKRKNALQLAMLLMTVMSGLLFFIGCGSTAFSPFFWIIAGLAIAEVDREKISE